VVTSFNGATSFQKWIADVHLLVDNRNAAMFQWGHFFSEMDSRLLCWVIMQLNRCFNGATSFQKWIAYNRETGNFPILTGFNGATSFQKWIGRARLDVAADLGGFNGATSFQKWIAKPVPIPRSPGGPFQWGHFFSEMDRMYHNRNVEKLT